MAKALTADDKRELRSLESAIHKANLFDLESARALKVISEKRLWRGQFSTFTEYCYIRWGLGMNAIQERIRAANVMEAFAEAQYDGPLPSSVSQASELAVGLPIGRGRGGLGIVWNEEAKKAVLSAWGDVLNSGISPISLTVIRHILSKSRPAIRSKTHLGVGTHNSGPGAYVSPRMETREIARRLTTVLKPAQVDALIGELLTISRNCHAIAAD